VILASPAYLFLLALAAGILFLYFLHTRRQQHEVPVLFLWEGLPNDSQTRAARVRVRIDLALFLQLLVLAAMVLALAQPAFLTKRPRLAGLAIVLDGSASLRGRSADGRPAADLARSEASALLDRYPTTPVALLELSTSPRVLAPLSTDHERARRAIAAWEPTWFGNGTGEDLTALLASQGGTFERVILLTDGQPSFSLPDLEVVPFSPGENLALTAFSVREDPSGIGSIAFVRVRNDTSAYRELTVRVSDGSLRILFPTLIPPGEEQAYVLPFPVSSGPAFTATIDGADTFPADDSRMFSLARRTEWRIRVVGQVDRYLRAALASVSPVRFLEASDVDSADITVAYGVPLPADAQGSVLLVHGSLPGVVEVGEDQEGDAGALAVDTPGDPLLTDVDPFDFVVRRTPVVRQLEAGVTLLSAGGEPVLWRAELSDRRVVLLAPDLIKTNLPLTVDFPILVRNILHWLSLADPSAPPPALVAGEPIPFAPYGVPERLKDPSGHETQIDPGSVGFLAKAPGIYQLTTSSGTYAIAVNVDWNESPHPAIEGASAPVAPEGSATTLDVALLPVWPFVAVLALALLVLESVIFQQPGFRRRKT
jgi:hypothetical protein